MPKYLRTCQMSVHGYPADMSIFCNLQLGLLKLQEDTPQADIDQDNGSLAGVMQGAVGRSLIPVLAPRVRECRCWAIICGFFRHRVRSRDASGRRFPNPTVWHQTGSWNIVTLSATVCSTTYIFKGHLNNINKWLFIFENIIERYNTMFKN